MQKDKFYLLIILGFLFILSRVPFIFSGYGLDPDAYYVMLSARRIWNTSNYFMSRPPAYPLFEILCALLLKGGFWLTNGMTVFISFLSTFPMSGILDHLGVKNNKLILFTFCFAPTLWIQSTCTMDYMWAVFFILMAYYLCLEEGYVLSSVLLGIAVGFRLTSGLMIIPLSLQALSQKQKVKSILGSFIIFTLISLLVYSPVFLTYGFSFLGYVPEKAPFYIWGYKILSELFGWPGFLILIIGLLFPVLKKLNTLNIFKDSNNNNKKILLLIIILYSLLFLKLPTETSYLIPAIPFALILLDKILPRMLLILFCVFFILNGLVSVGNIDKRSYRRDGQLRFLPVDYGIVIKNEIRRRAIYQNAQKILDITEAFPPDDKAIIIMAWYMPIFQFLNQDLLEETSLGDRYSVLKRKGRNLFFLESVTRQEAQILPTHRFKLYYLDVAKNSWSSSTDQELFKHAKQITQIDSYPVNY